MNKLVNSFALFSTVFSTFAFAQPVPRPVVPGLPPARPVMPGQPPAIQPPIAQPPYGGLPPARPVNPGLPPAQPVNPIRPPIAQPPYGGLPPAQPVNPVLPPIAQPPYGGLPPARPVNPSLPPAYPIYPGQPPFYVQPPIVVVPPRMPWPVFAPRPIYRPDPVYIPSPLPGNYRVLEGYAQPFNAGNLNWYKEYSIQVVEQGNGFRAITLFPDMICRSYGYCPVIDKSPIILGVSYSTNDSCGGTTYYGFTNYSNSVRSIILTDNTRSFCSSSYQGLLQLVVNNADGTQDLLIGGRTY